MLRLEFDVSPLFEGDPLHGLDLGHITVVSDDIRVSSADKCPAMMVFASIPDLLDGLQELLTTDLKEFRFFGIESSFFILFKKSSDGRIQVITRDRLITTLSPHVLAASVFRSVSDFLTSHPLERIDPGSDAASDDAHDSLAEFESFLREHCS